MRSRLEIITATPAGVSAIGPSLRARQTIAESGLA
jgi:hypothetical protein